MNKEEKAQIALGAKFLYAATISYAPIVIVGDKISSRVIWDTIQNVVAIDYEAAAAQVFNRCVSYLRHERDTYSGQYVQVVVVDMENSEALKESLRPYEDTRYRKVFYYTI